MKILFVASQAQLDGTGGGVTHTRGFLALLRTIGGATAEQLVLPLPLGHLRGSARRVRAFALSLVSPLPSKVHYLLGFNARRRIRAALANGPPDIVVFNGSDLLPLASEVDRAIPCVLLSHNVEARIIKQKFAGLSASAPLRYLLDRDVSKTRRMEQDGVRRMDLVVAISSEDANWYQDIASAPPVEVVSGTFGHEQYQGPRPPDERPLQLAYLAKMDWWPNRQGAEWFVGSVLDTLPIGSVEAHFFGPGSEAFAGRHPALQAHGFVDSLDEVWSAANFTICPILDGSGINIKLIESLYNRIPVLATPYACRGLPKIDDPGLAVVAPADWPGFLASDRAVELSRATVRQETAELFSVRDPARRVAALLRAMVHRRGQSA